MAGQEENLFEIRSLQRESRHDERDSNAERFRQVEKTFFLLERRENSLFRVQSERFAISIRWNQRQTRQNLSRSYASQVRKSSKKFVRFVSLNSVRVFPSRFKSVNQRFPSIKLGNFSLCEEPLRLGQLQGNRFEIFLRQKTKLFATFRFDSNFLFCSIKPKTEMFRSNPKKRWKTMFELGKKKVSSIISECNDSD